MTFKGILIIVWMLLGLSVVVGLVWLMIDNFKLVNWPFHLILIPWAFICICVIIWAWIGIADEIDLNL